MRGEKRQEKGKKKEIKSGPVLNKDEVKRVKKRMSDLLDTQRRMPGIYIRVAHSASNLGHTIQKVPISVVAPRSCLKISL